MAVSPRPPTTTVAITGLGARVGSESISNRDVAISLGLGPSWLTGRTGILTRRLCAVGETVLTLARDAVLEALADAGTPPEALGTETVVLYIQNGLTHLTPPPGILLCRELGLTNCRSTSIDGVCSEPVNAIELAELMLVARRCDRVIVCAAMDFTAAVAPADVGTVGLFSAGAGALVLERTANAPTYGTVTAIHAVTDTRYWDLGTIEVQGHERQDEGLLVRIGYYAMSGTDLARVCMRILPKVTEEVLRLASWKIDDVDLFVTHQPNAKLLEMGARRLRVEAARMPCPARTLGNMGPASLLVNLTMARDEGRLTPRAKVLLVSFGLGFSCGAVALSV